MYLEAIEAVSVDLLFREGYQNTSPLAHSGWLFDTAVAEGNDGSFLPDSLNAHGKDLASGKLGLPLRRVLIIDDEKLIANTVVRILNLNGFDAVPAYSGDAALELIDTFCPHIVLTDVRMPGKNGIEVGNLIRERCPSTRVVLFSGQAGVSNLIDAARNGHGFELWSKPLAPPELVRRLRALSSGS